MRVSLKYRPRVQSTYLLSVTFQVLPFHSDVSYFFKVHPCLQRAMQRRLTFIGSGIIEKFSIDCRKTNTKVISLADHKGHRQSNEQIQTQSKYMQQARSAGKRARASHEILVEKVARSFQSDNE